MHLFDMRRLRAYLTLIGQPVKLSIYISALKCAFTNHLKFQFILSKVKIPLKKKW